MYPQIKNQFRELGHRRVFEEKMQTEAKSQKKIAHLIQLGSIIGATLSESNKLWNISDHLQAHNLLEDSSDSCLIDLGSGRAQLVYWLAKEAPRCRYLLVDKVGTRNKFENKARHVSCSVAVYAPLLRLSQPVKFEQTTLIRKK